MDRETQARLLIPLLAFVLCAALVILGLVKGTVRTGEIDMDNWPQDFRAKKTEHPLMYWIWIAVWGFGACFFGWLCVALLRF